MNLKKLRYKTIAYGVGVAALLFSPGCKDFLDKDIEDQKAESGIRTFDDYRTLTSALYGGRIWADYNAKFAWAANDGLAGILYNIFDAEGQFFKLAVNANNDILLKGYTSLYSGVISSANQIINKDKPTLSDDEANRINAEARMWRGMAYFLATEYWGEVPLVLDNEKDIANSVVLPKMDRATLYRAIELDWLFAAEYLPEEDANGKVTRWAAKGMLAKLYLTMASCQTAELKCPYVCDRPAEYYQRVIDLTTEVIDKSGASLDSYADIFDVKKRMSSNESLFATYWAEGRDYGYGSQSQVQFARDGSWSPSGGGWGGGKGLSYTLYKSYDARDVRKKETSMYVGETYKYYDGSSVSYGSDLLSGIGVLNNLKKYVYGISCPVHYMSTPMRIDFLRLADVYMMRAEAKMAQAALDAKIAVTTGIDDLNKVLEKHAGYTLPEGETMAFYTPVAADYPVMTYEEEEVTYSYTSSVPMYHGRKRTDFIQERMKEFAIEGQAWFDLKRLYYRNPAYAKAYLMEQDRFCEMTQAPGATEAEQETELGYARKTLVNGINEQRGETVLSVETDLVSTVNAFDAWFLPFPASVVKVSNTVENRVSDLNNGTYPY